MSRKISSKQVDAIWSAIHGIRMMAGVISDSTDGLNRPGAGDAWQIDAEMGDRLAYFSLAQLDAVKRLEEMFIAAVVK